MFDEALTSEDERVVNALRSLMMMTILTKPEGRKSSQIGPLRQLFDDMHQLNRNVVDVSERLLRLEHETRGSRAYNAYDQWDRQRYEQQRYTSGNPITMLKEDYDAAMNSILKTTNKPTSL